MLGLSHLALSVRDVAKAKEFWVDAMGFEVVTEEEAFCSLLERGARMAVIITDHTGTVAGPFDERRVGLDHLALAVPDVETLLCWEQRLRRLGVLTSEITESDAGHHLNLRAPDGVAIELFVMGAAMAVSLGIGSGADAVAGTHR